VTNDQSVAIAEMLTIVSLIVTAVWSYPLVMTIAYGIATLGHAFTPASLFEFLLSTPSLIWLSTLPIVIGCFRLRRWMIGQIKN